MAMKLQSLMTRQMKHALFKLLSVNNLITFKQNIDVTKASEKDIESNPQ